MHKLNRSLFIVHCNSHFVASLQQLESNVLLIFILNNLVCFFLAKATSEGINYLPVIHYYFLWIVVFVCLVLFVWFLPFYYFFMSLRVGRLSG